ADAVAAAGGVTTDADTGRLPNLSERVHDGKQVNVPFRRSTSGGGSASVSTRLDVNAATADELRAIPTMPIGLAEAIVDARATFGPFQSLSQMKNTLGLDSQTFTAIRPYLRAGTSTR
ncbi:MAG TPA: helix-hairpin-helix domain-containing protein, partial [Candidatus Dormibacteraeota bacterium]|nr:helix-hairpin-helix domain-containing protein [Candidatus Dormibacteraeota bacterium]